MALSSFLQMTALLAAVLQEKTRARTLALVLGFEVDATENPWKTNYRMYSYVTAELPQLINANFAMDPLKEVYFWPL